MKRPSGSARRRIAWGVALAAGIGFSTLAAASTASDDSAPGADETALRQRVQGYWKAKIERSSDVYDFYVPPEAGGAEPGFPVFGNIHYGSYEIADLVLDGDVAHVKGQVRIETIEGPIPGIVLRHLKANPRNVYGRWRKIGGTWYRERVEGPSVGDQLVRPAPHPEDASEQTDGTGESGRGPEAPEEP